MAKSKIETLIEEERWEQAREAIRKALKKAPADHWLLTRMSTTYYEERDYESALEWSDRAFAEAPNCPLVLWDRAGTLDMLGRTREALAVYGKLLERGIQTIAEDECGEGEEWAASLLTDCVYRAARCFEDLSHPWPALVLSACYLRLRDLGCESIYPREEASAGLFSLLDRARRDHPDESDEIARVEEAARRVVGEAAAAVK
jgi:tetratricopeptide (TPR) repeat protein